STMTRDELEQRPTSPARIATAVGARAVPGRDPRLRLERRLAYLEGLPAPFRPRRARGLPVARRRAALARADGGDPRERAPGGAQDARLGDGRPHPGARGGPDRRRQAARALPRRRSRAPARRG